MRLEVLDISSPRGDDHRRWLRGRDAAADELRSARQALHCKRAACCSAGWRVVACTSPEGTGWSPLSIRIRLSEPS